MLPFELTKDTPYLALSGELWSVFYEYFNRNWPCYKGFLLYIIVTHVSHEAFKRRIFPQIDIYVDKLTQRIRNVVQKCNCISDGYN